MPVCGACDIESFPACESRFAAVRVAAGDGKDYNRAGHNILKKISINSRDEYKITLTTRVLKLNRSLG
jgi:hypothetical protein